MADLISKQLISGEGRFIGANLDGADFSRARLQGARFDNAILTGGVELDGALLQESNFVNADLTPSKSQRC